VIGGAEAGKNRFGVVDVTMERNSVRLVRPTSNANDTLTSHRVSSLAKLAGLLAVRTGHRHAAKPRGLYSILRSIMAGEGRKGASW
jgi:hypothetical protein